MMMEPDVNVHLIDFPVRGKEMIFSNEDGTYTIFINARLSYEAQLQAYEHALKHIQNEDFQKTDIQEIEYTAHKIEKSNNTPAVSKVDNEWKKKAEEKIKRSRRERKKLQKQFRERQKSIEFLLKHESEDFLFDSLEYGRLYDGL